MDTFVTVLALFGGAFLLLILLLTLVVGRLLHRGKKMIREGRWPGQSCAVCGQPISSPDQAVGVLAQASPETAAETSARLLFAHRSCADTNSDDATAGLAQATAGERTCPHCRHVFTPDGMTTLRPGDPAQDRDGLFVKCPRCRNTWLTGRRVD